MLTLLRGGDVRLELMRLQRIEEWVAVEFIVAFDTDFQGDVGSRAGNAKQDIAVVDLTVVQGHLAALINLTCDEFRRAGDAAAVFAAIRQSDALLAQGVEQRAARIDGVCRAVAVGEGYSAGLGQSQISLVQSPPG